MFESRPEFECDWRPETYWPSLPTDDDLISRVRGARRREALRHALAASDFSDLDPSIVREALNHDERRALLHVHPSLALGEYLPELEEPDLPQGEVEIARLYLASGIGNTISLRARSVGSEIELRAVDEFEDRLTIAPARLSVPLSNSELLAAVKTLEWHGPLASGNVWQTRESEAELDIESAAEFISGDSRLYPALRTAMRLRPLARHRGGTRPPRR